MSGPTIRINDMGSFPEVSASQDLGSTMEITNINDFDLGMLGNQRKLGGATPPRAASPGISEIKEVDNIEFVNLEDTAVTYDVKPPVNNSTGDTIKILRDNSQISPPAPFSTPAPAPGPTLNLSGSSFGAAPAPAPAGPAKAGWFSSLTGSGAAPAPAESSGVLGGFKSFFGGGGGGASASAPAPAPASAYEYLTPEQETAKKMEGLTLLERMDRKGVGGTKMTIANSLDEINSEVARRKDSKGLEASIRFQRSMLTTVTHGMEFLNSRYDPLGIALDGWSEKVSEDIEDYDEIFEELYDKYKDKSKVAPEVRLIMSLGLSAAMCHVTNTMFKSRMPGMDDILRKNPDLANQMARAAAEQVGPGFGKFVSLGMNGGGRSAPSAASMSAMAAAAAEEESGMPFMPPMGSGFGGAIPTMDPRGAPGMDAPVTARREMRGPTGVEDILNTLNAHGEGHVSRSTPMPAAMEAEELGSVMSGMTTETMRRAGLNRRRKATTTQPTGTTLTLNV
jgi:hypothetical protein